MLVEVKGAAFGYEGRPVVQIRQLDLHAGRCLGMFGPNGSGKTTLVRGIAGLLEPMRGKVVRQSSLRVGYLPQHRGMDSHWPITALDAASIAASTRRVFGWVDAQTRETILGKMGILEVADLANRRQLSLSGGQQQRVLLAGALAALPELLVLDEPTEGLDVRSRAILLCALRQAAEGGLCTILISHVIDDLIALCDQIAWFHPPEEPQQPTQVEVVPTSEMAQRVVRLRETA